MECSSPIPLPCYSECDNCFCSKSDIWRKSTINGRSMVLCCECSDYWNKYAILRKGGRFDTLLNRIAAKRRKSEEESKNLKKLIKPIIDPLYQIQPQTPEEYDDELSCAVCWSFSDDHNNLMASCSDCGIRVHQGTNRRITNG
jgi:hypothetical protein